MVRDTFPRTHLLLTYFPHLLRVKGVVSATAKPSTSSLASYMAQSPPTSPQVQAFKSFTPSPPSTRFVLNVKEPNGQPNGKPNGHPNGKPHISSSLKPEARSL